MERELRDLTALFQRIVLDSPFGAKGVAAELDKAPSTLYDELSPSETKGAGKLGLLDGVRIMDILQDTEPLSYMAGMLGMRVVPMAGHTPDAPDLNIEMLQGFEATARYLEAARAGDEEITELNRLMNQAIEELEEVFTRIRNGREKGAGRSVA